MDMHSSPGRIPSFPWTDGEIKRQNEWTDLRQALAELSVEGVPLLGHLLHLDLQLGRLLLLVLEALHLAHNSDSIEFNYAEISIA